MPAVVDRYKFEPKMSRVERIAHFFDWASEKLPYQPIPPNLVLKAIMGYSKKPRLGTEEVDSVVNAICRARVVLHNKYKRGLLVVQGEGARATVDDTDTARTTLRRTAARFESARRSVARERVLVDPAQIKDAALRNWVNEGVDDALKKLGATDRIFALLPPASAEPKKDPKK